MITHPKRDMVMVNEISFCDGLHFASFHVLNYFVNVYLISFLKSCDMLDK